MITIEIDNQQVSNAIAKLTASLQRPHKALVDIGEYLVDSTKQRFATSTAPDGTRWAPNTQVTILQYLSVKSGKYEAGKRVETKDGFFYKKGKEKKGKVAAKGIQAITSKRPLIGETGALALDIAYKFDASGDLFIGSPLKYAGTQQFGARQYQFKGKKTPWGDIPARPFLGISNKDEENILGIITDYLMPSTRR